MLYKLPELIAEPLLDWVFVVEGEKDVDRLMSEGLAATTNAGGAGKWLADYNEYFRGRNVAIIADNDEPGRRHAKMVAEAIYDCAATVKIIELDGLPAKGDVSDWLDAGHSFRELSVLVDDASIYEKGWTKRAEVVSLSKIEPEEIEWLWPNRIPLGMLTLLTGDPGVGKSFLTLYMASRITSACNWPDGTMSAYGSVIIISCEDSLEHVIRPRLGALNANLSKIMAIRSIRHKDKDGSEFTEQFNITADLFELERVLQDNPDTKLVIIDPLSAYFGCIDTHKDSNVRAVLAPLVELARRYSVALVCVMHLNKGNSPKAVYRTMGSLAFPAAARTVWLVSPDPGRAAGQRRLLIAAKHNILRDPTTLAFEIKDGQVVFEDKPVNVTADDVLSPASNIEAPERQRAIDWLRELLSDGKSKSSNEIFRLAGEQGFKETTLKRARNELGVRCFPEFDEEGNKFWYWRLPKADEDKKKLSTASEILARMPKMPKLSIKY